MTGPRTMAGGCLCGRVRFEADLASNDSYACHCRMCQRAVGAPFAAFTNLPAADVRWTGAPPDSYASSPIAVRGFCATCGTAISFRYPDSERMDLTVAAFDEPEWFVPSSNFGVESRLSHWRSLEGLKELRSDAYQPLTDRWMRAVGHLPA